MMYGADDQLYVQSLYEDTLRYHLTEVAFEDYASWIEVGELMHDMDYPFNIDEPTREEWEYFK